MANPTDLKVLEFHSVPSLIKTKKNRLNDIDYRKTDKFIYFSTAMLVWDGLGLGQSDLFEEAHKNCTPNQ